MVALQYLLDPSVETLDHAVGLRGFRRCQAVFDVQFGAELVELVGAGGCPARGQAQNAARLGINTQHRVQQNTAPRTLADLAQTATAFLGRLEIEFAAVLDRQNMPALAAL